METHGIKAGKKCVLGAQINRGSQFVGVVMKIYKNTNKIGVVAKNHNKIFKQKTTIHKSTLCNKDLIRPNQLSLPCS